MINFIENAHAADYYENYWALNENSDVSLGSIPIPIVAEKIVINHYVTKSKKEYEEKINRGMADSLGKRSISEFEGRDRNEEFDDGILKYRDARAKVYQPPDKAHVDERLFSALARNLSPTLVPTTPPQFYAGKMETFLTCRAVAAYLQTKLTDDKPAKFFEEASLVATLRTIASSGMTFADAQLLLSELPNLLTLPYPEVNDLRGACLQIIPQMMNIIRLNSTFNRYNSWKNYSELDYIQRLLQTWK